MKPDIDVHIVGPAAHLRIAGNLEYDGSDSLVDLATHILDAHVGLADLHLDFAALTSFDNAALAAVLLIHRRVCRAQVRLHLDHRPDFLDHILDVTGTRDHLTTTPAVSTTAPPATTAPAEHRSL